MRILKIDDSVPVKRCLFSNPAASQSCSNKDEQICDFLKQAIKVLQNTFDQLSMDDILLDNQKAIALSHRVIKS